MKIDLHKHEEQAELMSQETGTQTTFERSATLFMAFVCAISLLAITGWLFNQPLLASIRPEFIPMDPSTALIFLGLCGAGLIYRFYSARRGMRILVQAGLVGMLLIVLVIALRYIAGLGLDLEQWLYPNPSLFGQISNARLSPLTALGFFLAIPAFLLLTRREPGQRTKSASAALSLAVFFISGFIILSYLYGAPPFYGGTLIPVSVITTLSFLFLSLGLLMTAGPACWPVRMYVGPSLKARLMRAIIPASIGIVLLQGFLSTVAAPWIVNPALRVALAALMAMLILIPIISLIAQNLSTEIERGKQAEEALRAISYRQQVRLSAVPDIIMEVDNNKVYTWANQPGQEFFGEDVIGHEAAFYFEGEQDTYEKVNPLFEGVENIIYIESWQRRQDGQKRLLAWWCHGLKDANGNVTGIILSSARDITEQRQVEIALIDERNLLVTLLDNVPDMIYFKDVESRFIRVSQAHARRFGLNDPSQIVGKTDFDFFGEEHARAAYEDEQAIIRSGQPLVAKEEKETFLDGRALWVSTTKMPLRDQQGQIIGTFGISRDITERKQTEEALRKSESSLQAVLQSTVDGILAVSNENEVLYASERFAEIWRIPQAIMSSKDDSILLQYVLDQLSDPQSFHKKVQELYKSKEESFDTLNFKDGRVFERLSRPLMEGVEVLGRVWSFRDITERKWIEEKLEKERILLRTLIDNIPDLIYAMDVQGRKIISNIADWRASGGKTMEDVIGKTDLDTYPLELAKKFWAVNMEVIDSGISILNREEPGLDSQGNPVWVLSSKVPLRDSHGKIAGLVGIGRDITDRKKAERLQDAIYRITQAAEKAESLDSLYPSIHAIIQEVMVADNFYFALYDEKKDLLSFPYYIDQYNELPPALLQMQGLTGYVIRSGRPLLATREIFANLIHQGEVEALGMVGVDWIGAPLKVEGRMIGVMAVQNYTQGIHFNQKDTDLLEFVSTQVAQAIERKRLEEEIRSLSLTDELTGLYNRRGFTLLAEREVKLAHRMNRAMQLFFGDVDNLKIINDTWGHAHGDLALKEISAILKQNFRESDILARIGGDEFVVLAVDASKESAEILTNRIQSALEVRNQLGDESYQLSISLGVACYDPEDPRTLSELIAQADGLMYHQKQARKGKTGGVS